MFDDDTPLTDEQLWAFYNNPEIKKLVSPEDWALLEESMMAYAASVRACEYAEAKAATAQHVLFQATVRMVDGYRRDPAALDLPCDCPCAAVRERVRRVIDEGEEVTDELIAELGELQNRFGPPGGGWPTPPAEGPDAPDTAK